MSPSRTDIVILAVESSTSAPYENHPIAAVNDHEIRISVMTEPFPWHLHPDSDETLLCLEGGIHIDFYDCTITLHPGQMLTVPRNTRHRTRPISDRSVNVTFERRDARTVFD